MKRTAFYQAEAIGCTMIIQTIMEMVLNVVCANQIGQICVHLDLPLVTGHIQTSVSHLCAHRHFFFVCITDCILYPESQFASALFMCPYSVFVNMSKNKLSVCMCV